jgi:phosphate starvation-inducible PhoH-like protein
VPQTSVGALFGPYDENLRHVEALLNVKIRTQGHELMVDGHPRDTARVERWVGQVSGLLGDGHSLSDTDIRTAAQLVSDNDAVDLHEHFLKGGQLRHAGKRRITAKSANQRLYLDAIEQHDIVFGIGPAGTGKTYLAMAQAVSALLAKKVARIILARPAVEAGEKLGFLPGDLQEKVNPYLRPLYDALYDMLDVERAQRLLERGTIEVAPIAFMRGRTLNDAFVILDEAQNTTTEQMKMFLTRLGFGSKAVVTGDITQIDLPGSTRSGLNVVRDILFGVDDVHFAQLSSSDVVRHRLVADIVDAYARWDAANERPNLRAAAPRNGPPQDRRTRRR